MIKEIKEYIASFSEIKQERLLELYVVIKENVPKETEERITWNMPTFYLKGFLIHFSGQKKHIGLHIGTTTVEEFKNKFSNMKHTKSTLHLPYEKDLPRKLIEEIIKYKVKENYEKLS